MRFRASRLRLSGASHARLPVLGGGSPAKPEVAADSRAHFTFSQIIVHARHASGDFCRVALTANPMNEISLRR